jgi:hypothetical protein
MSDTARARLGGVGSEGQSRRRDGGRRRTRRGEEDAHERGVPIARPR